jgi:hypothetical protein
MCTRVIIIIQNLHRYSFHLYFSILSLLFIWAFTKRSSQNEAMKLIVAVSIVVTSVLIIIMDDSGSFDYRDILSSAFGKFCCGTLIERCLLSTRAECE